MLYMLSEVILYFYSWYFVTFFKPHCHFTFTMNPSVDDALSVAINHKLRLYCVHACICAHIHAWTHTHTHTQWSWSKTMKCHLQTSQTYVQLFLFVGRFKHNDFRMCRFQSFTQPPSLWSVRSHIKPQTLCPITPMIPTSLEVVEAALWVPQLTNGFYTGAGWAHTPYLEVMDKHNHIHTFRHIKCPLPDSSNVIKVT